MENAEQGNGTGISRARLITGVTVFVVGQASTLAIPLVSALDIPTIWKSTISGMLFFVTPQIGIVAAVAILGKSGYDHVKSIVFHWFKKHAPAEVVSRTRYRVGLVMFSLPLLFAWVSPYWGHLIPGYETKPALFGIAGDVMFVASFFVLGGKFWDKIRALFIYE